MLSRSPFRPGTIRRRRALTTPDSLLMAAALIWTHLDSSQPGASLSGPVLAIVGLVAGFSIGVVAAVRGVAGGNLLIPTIVLL